MNEGHSVSKSSEIQAHTDKYQLVGAVDPDSGEIKAVNLGDGTVLGLAVQQYVWDTDTLSWAKAQQPQFSLTGEVQVDNAELEALVTETNTRIGEVLASPVANTLQGRLKQAVDLLDILDDWDESDRAKVNLIAGQAGIAAGAGAVGATVPRITLASDDPLLVATQDVLANYKFSGYSISGDDIYTGYEDKDGAYYVTYYNLATGVITYAVGSGGIVVPGSYSGLSYGSFASKF